MRFSSIVALVVVTASFALGGCAADAESTDAQTQDNVTHEAASTGSDSIDENSPAVAKDAYGHALVGQEDRVRIVAPYEAALDPRIETQPPAFGHNRVHLHNTVSPEEIRAIAEAHANGTTKP